MSTEDQRSREQLLQHRTELLDAYGYIMSMIIMLCHTPETGWESIPLHYRQRLSQIQQELSQLSVALQETDHE